MRRALVGAFGALLQEYAHGHAALPQAERAPQVLAANTGRLLRVDPLVAWESLQLSRALHISLQAGVAASPAFASQSWQHIGAAGAEQGVQGAAFPVGAGAARVWQEKYVAIYHRLARARYANSLQLALSYDPATYNGQETLVVVAYGWEEDCACYAPLQAQGVLEGGAGKG